MAWENTSLRMASRMVSAATGLSGSGRVRRVTRSSGVMGLKTGRRSIPFRCSAAISAAARAARRNSSISMPKAGGLFSGRLSLMVAVSPGMHATESCRRESTTDLERGGVRSRLGRNGLTRPRVGFDGDIGGSSRRMLSPDLASSATISRERKSLKMLIPRNSSRTRTRLRAGAAEG